MAVPSKNESVDILNIIQIAKNITESKRAEGEEKKLENLLLRLQNMEATGMLVRGLAHDFNNFMTVIISYANFLLMDIDQDNPMRQDVEEIKNAGQRAASLIQQVLTFGRGQVFQLTVLDLNKKLSNISNMLQRLMGEDIELVMVLKSALWRIKADPSQIERVTINLAVNARDAMPQGGKLTIETANVDLDETYAREHGVEFQPGPYVTLTVSDTGIGIDKETKFHLFEPYFTTKTKIGGTGMGLAVVHGIVKSHDGAITVDSEVGKGTTFHVFFPRIERTEYVAKNEGLVLPSRGNERILFVDDEQGIVDMSRQMLERLGYEVIIRTSSIEALEAFRAHPEIFDLVITDMTMPNMTGDELARELIGIRSDIPIILCTGYSERITEEKAKAIGIRKFVMKPLVVTEIAEAIREVLDSG